MRKFTPNALEKFNWNATRNLTRYIGVTTFIAMTLMIDCHNFFLKSLLWVPADHWLVLVRVFTWGLHAGVCSKEWFEFISNPNCKRVGPFAWLAFYVCAIELLIILKFAPGEFVAPMPAWIFVMWAAVLALWLCGLAIATKNQIS